MAAQLFSAPRLLSRRRRLIHLNNTVFNSTRREDVSKLSGIAINDRISGYRVTGVTEVSDFNLKAIELLHESTKAQHLHLVRQDSNNVFGVGFRTTPMDSTGISHILEHTTLCGSAHYPVRDPFFKMLTRSLATFMNAFTANDWTFYPFSTQNYNDYRNLLSVYCDCVFHPNLKKMDFHQEGWRLEHEDPNDRNTPLVFKGVVFNEMKGMFSNAEYLFDTELQRKLLPSHTYSHVSGGAPLNILDLTWDSLKEFHAKHYHPSNSYFYTYGDIPLSDHLSFIDENVLSKFSVSTPAAAIPLEARWNQPRSHEIYCAPDPMAPDPNKQTTVGVAYLLGPITDSYEGLLLSILTKLLIDGAASPFYQSLIDSNIGSDYSPSTGYNDGTKDSYFSVGLQGISTEDAEKVKQIITETFHKVYQEGFPEERVKAILHQVEIGLKHQSSNFGLALLMHFITPWIHGASPTSLLQINQNVENFKDHMANDPNYLKEKIKEYFIDNKHNLTLVMSPDVEYNKKQKELEEEKLRLLVSSLSEDDKQRVYDEGLQLQEDQNKHQTSDCLPSLSVADVDKTTPITELIHEDHGSIPIQYCVQPTNGISYLQFLSSCRDLPDDLKPYLPLFCSVITKMGTQDLDYRQLSQQIDLYTGGSVCVGTHVASHHSIPNQFEQAIALTSHCLDRHLPYMLSIWEDIFNKPQLQDEQRLQTLIAMEASSLAVNVSRSGHRYAMTASASSLSPAAMMAEKYGGISQVKFMKDIAETSDLKPVLEKLASIAVAVLDTGCMRVAFNVTEPQFTVASEAAEGFLDNLPGSITDTPLFMEEGTVTPTLSHTHYQLPFQVYYVGQSYRTVPYTHEDSPSLRVLAQLMGWKYLHKEIREKGGAYGGGAKHGNGIFSFFSYRDPHSLDTVNRFNDSIDWVTSRSFTDEDVEEAKLSVFSQVDSPVSPGSKGSSLFLQGLTHEMRAQYRSRLFEVSGDHLVSVATKYLKEAEHKGSVIIGPEIKTLSPEWTIKHFSL
ncbi:PREDICTED: presequence protease, mitochondrial-like isoform X1 [Amphimedon queenslandica]|uniref:Presequence protease, mitochondrial n=1 Tax=Amphimedon queenslandica TaxID=400682 RepID=A0AAN0IW58_AMPQE|nr:PREDICTED: presequence protease, mitochondrial-like isoform X1 [Amphimedon queenslandica]|eukprot:XP_019848663.1 PREDICTED: presequence protease, mitochondrial-like isoform X1 [Amphimedon queenslandica]